MLQAKYEAYIQYKKTGVSEKVWPSRFKTEYPYLKEVDSLALANVGLNLLQAFRSCYELHLTEKPRFHSKKNSRKAYRTNNQKDSIRIIGSYLKLPKTGKVKARFHRLPKAGWILKSVTITQESDNKFYAAVTFEMSCSTISRNSNGPALGLDYKSNGLYMNSEGKTADMPHYFRKSQKRLKRQQHKLSRKIGNKKDQTKSKNYYKQLQKINCIHVHIANQRKDFLHKQSAAIAKQYSIVCVETLNLKTIGNKKHHLGKATYDNGYGMFLHMLDYKLRRNGGILVKVGKWYPSSQLCHHCGHKQKMPLNIRTYNCSECGASIDRDYNAALNIRDEGLRILKEQAV